MESSGKSKRGKSSTSLPLMTSMISTMNAFTLFIYNLHHCRTGFAVFLFADPKKSQTLFSLYIITVSWVDCHCYCYSFYHWMLFVVAVAISFLYTNEIDRSHYLQHAFMPIWHKIELRRKIMAKHRYIQYTFTQWWYGYVYGFFLLLNSQITITIEFHSNLSIFGLTYLSFT